MMALVLETQALTTAVGATEAMPHGDLPGGDVQYHLGMKKGLKQGVSVAGRVGHFFLEGDQAADTAGEDHTNPVGIHIVFADAGVFFNFIAGDKGELGPVDLAGFLAIEIGGGSGL